MQIALTNLNKVSVEYIKKIQNKLKAGGVVMIKSKTFVVSRENIFITETSKFKKTKQGGIVKDRVPDILEDKWWQVCHLNLTSNLHL